MAADMQRAPHSLDQTPEEDGDTIGDAERKAIAEADEWLKRNQPIRHEKVLLDLGLTVADWERMGREPLPEEIPRRDG
jgi:hypothetical protein